MCVGGGGGGGGLKCILLVPNLHTLKHKNVYLAWRFPNFFIVSSYRKFLIRLTHYDETKKRAHDIQIELKTNLKLSYGGPSCR